MKQALWILMTLIIVLLVIQPITFAHRDGCHRWHSCPSDTGSYVCGDLGYCSECPDNEYCGTPITIQSTEPSPTPTPTQPIPAVSKSVPVESQPTTPPTSQVVYPPTPTITPSQPTNQPTVSVDCKGTFQGTVKKIIDGDTLAIKGCKTTIRLSLVDTPEYYENGYAEAVSFASNLCKVGSTATIDQDDKQPYDKYGRIVALVYCQNEKLNAELIYNKLGVIDTRFCSTSEFVNEDWAKDYGCEVKQITPSEELPTAQITKTAPSDKGLIVSIIYFLKKYFSIL